MKRVLLLIFLMAFLVITPTPSFADEWRQDAHDAQHTGYTTEEPLAPWSFAWRWNGSDSAGGVSCTNNDPTKGHCYDAPREARTITGGGKVYVPAGTRGLFALNLTTGNKLWNTTVTNFNATPAYDTNGYIFAGGENGVLYKINATTGAVAQSFNAGSPISKSVIVVGGFVFAVSDNGQLHKISTSSMSRSWVYSANSTIATPPAYSPSKDIIVFATDDLYVHAVNNSTGTQKWRTKPSPNPAGFPNEFERSWPVVADRHGVVFLRMRLDHNNGVWSQGIYPNTNTETRNLLISKPYLKNLFALNLDNGSEKFIPAVGYGGVEDLVNGSPFLHIGSLPVIKTFSDGTEVAYMTFRNGQSNPGDARGDSHMGEMVLDSGTISGLVAGDLRFVQMAGFKNSYVYITDEQTPITVAGNSLFNAHWGASEGIKILDRSNSLGLTYSNPITSSKYPSVIRRMSSCSNYNTSTHYTSCTLFLYNDGRSWGSGGWWVYWNVLDPPTPNRSAYSDGIRPRYTYVSDGYIIIEGNGGDLMALKHSGLTSPTLTNTPLTATPTLVLKPGDANGDGKVDGFDYVIWWQNFGKNLSGSQNGDFNNDGRVDGFDYVIWWQNFGK